METDEVLIQIKAWIEQGNKVAMATVISTWGSSPRPVGSQLGVNDKGAFVGSVSGGCIESFVVSEAIDVIETGKPQILEYGVSDEQAREVRLACGGMVRVFVEPAPTVDHIGKMISEQPISRVVDMGTGASVLVKENGIVGGDLPLDEDLLAKARNFSRSDSSDQAWSGDTRIFIRSYAPPKRIVIIGAVHITQALVPIAVTVGFDVVVIDPRPLFTKEDRLPGVALIRERPDKFFQEHELDAQTAVVALAHDPDLDDPALKAALGSPAYYIGALGSRKSHEKRLTRLKAAGFEADALARIHGPIGLDIGGQSPGHIALSIMAEIIAVGNGKP